jgi:hypothetical protein
MSKKDEAEARNKAWQKLSPAEQLKELDKRLGKDQGAHKQRKKIKEKIK